MKRFKLLFLGAVLAGVSACSGMRTNNGTFYTHAESIRILGFVIPGDDMNRARELVPASATIETVQSNPADWSSLLGVINNILGIGVTQISGTVPAQK